MGKKMTLASPGSHYRKAPFRMLGWFIVGAILFLPGCEAGSERALLAPSDPEFATVQVDCSGPDVTTCVQGAIDTAGTNGTVLFNRGVTYTFNSAAFLVLKPGTELRATGEGARPILQFEQEHHGGSIRLAQNAKIVSLDIRGPFAFSTVPPRALMLHDESCSDGGTHCPLAYGVNGAASQYWLIDDTHVNGFRDNGVLMAGSTGAIVQNSNVSYNGRTGVAAYCEHPSLPSTGYQVLNSVLEHNGQDGIDSCGDEAIYRGNVAGRNGWAGWPGDQNGILVAYGSGVEVVDNYAVMNDFDGIVVRGGGHRIFDNVVDYNQGSGIRLDSLDNTLVRKNAAFGNAKYGVEYPPGPTGFVKVGVCQTSGDMNGWGLLQPNPPSGVQIKQSSCDVELYIDGPPAVQAGLEYTWQSVPSWGDGVYHQNQWLIYWDDFTWEYLGTAPTQSYVAGFDKVGRTFQITTSVYSDGKSAGVITDPIYVHF